MVLLPQPPLWVRKVNRLTCADGGGTAPTTTFPEGTILATPAVTFLSYNSTGLDTVKTAWTRDLCKMTNADYLTVQEHFKKNKLVDKYFTEQFPDYSPYVIPAYRENTQDSGRPKGGIAQLSKKSIKVKNERVGTKSFWIHAQVLLPTLQFFRYSGSHECPQTRTFCRDW